MSEINIRSIRKIRRQKRVRNKVLSKRDIPRLTVFRSNKFTYAQVIDDVKGTTLASVTEKEIKSTGNKVVKAEEIGRILAEKAIKKKVKQVVFDKGSYRYHGRVKAVADGARAGGLEF